jgi:hypothetical protein
MNLKLLPADWLTGPSKVPEWLAGTAFDPTPALDNRLAYGVWLGRVGKAYLGVGVTGTYGALKPIIDNFGRDASRVYFPAPESLSSDAKDESRGLLLMVFDRDGLARAAASLTEMSGHSSTRDTSRPKDGK